MTQPQHDLQEIVTAWTDLLARVRTKAAAAGREQVIPLRDGHPTRPPEEFYTFRIGYMLGYRACLQAQLDDLDKPNEVADDQPDIDDSA